MRDPGLEELIEQDLTGEPGLSAKPMFGGLCWLLDGRLLCGARHDGLLVRLGKGNDDWATALPGVRPMINGSRPMPGWVRADEDAYGDDQLRRRLLDCALGFVREL